MPVAQATGTRQKTAFRPGMRNIKINAYKALVAANKFSGNPIRGFK